MGRSTGLDAILRLPEGPERTGGLAAWFQSLYEGVRVPILVGGAAVELYTGGAYTTGDLDFVGEVSDSVAARLDEAGFRREGRHWILGEGEVFIELPGSQLEPGLRSAVVRVGGRSVLVIGPEEILVDRLAAWQFWKSSIDGVNAFLLRDRLGSRLDLDRVLELATKRQCANAFSALEALVGRLGGRNPSPSELEEWSEQRL